jgi:hypothetical protein
MALPNTALEAVVFAALVAVRILLKVQLATCAFSRKGNKIPEKTRTQIFSFIFVFISGY